MVRHNNVVPNQHFKKKWQFYVKTWFNQPARKHRRRDGEMTSSLLLTLCLFHVHHWLLLLFTAVAIVGI